MPLRTPTLRHALRQPLRSPRATQRRWAQVHDVRFLVTHGSQERILAKYKEKLEHKAREKGLKDLDELKEQYKDKMAELRKQAIVPIVPIVPGATGPLTPPPETATTTTTTITQPPPKSPWPSPPPPPAASGSPTAPPPGVKTLNSFLDLDKVRTLPEKEVQALWRLRHAANPQSIHFALPATTFSQLLRSAKQHPSFVLPVPREIPAPASSAPQEQPQMQQAAELHYLQFSHAHIHTTTLMFTTLAEFKLRGEFASPHTTITFHQELTDSHNLVLGQGLVIENRGVSVDDARWLVMCMQKFYVQTEEGKARRQRIPG